MLNYIGGFMDTKEKFKEEFEKTCNLVLSQFPNKNDKDAPEGKALKYYIAMKD